MSLLTVLSWTCIVGGTLLGLPQAWRILSSRTTEGLSLLSWQSWLGGNLAWFVHGVLISSLTQIVPNLVGAACALLIVRLTSRARSVPWWRAYGPSVALFGVALAVRLGLGPATFGAFMVVPAGAAMLGQLLDLVRSRSVRGVSWPYLAIFVALQAAWFFYGRLLPDVAAAVSATVLVVLASLNLGWYVARRLGVPALWPHAHAHVVDPVDGVTAPGPA